MATGSNHLLKLHRRAIFASSQRRRSSDVHSHAPYFSLFMIGSLFINEQTVWQAVDDQRGTSLDLATLSMKALAAF